MSWYCIHEKTWSGNFDDPPETWCELYDDCDCYNCPSLCSEEDYENERINYEYDRYKDSLDF